MRPVARDPLLEQLIGELRESLELTESLAEHIYCSAADGKGTIGAHIRHNLDFVSAFVRGVRLGSVDYADRGRDKRTETNRNFAAARIRSTILSLMDCGQLDPAGLLTVRSEIRPDIRHRSSISRELEFVYSHTVHHHALIRERLRQRGVDRSANFGVARSTQNYWDSLSKAA